MIYSGEKSVIFKKCLKENLSYDGPEMKWNNMFEGPDDAGKRQARLSTSPRKEDGLVSIFDPVEVESGKMYFFKGVFQFEDSFYVFGLPAFCPKN